MATMGLEPQVGASSLASHAALAASSFCGAAVGVVGTIEPSEHCTSACVASTVLGGPHCGASSLASQAALAAASFICSVAEVATETTVERAAGERVQASAHETPASTTTRDERRALILAEAGR